MAERITLSAVIWGRNEKTEWFSPEYTDEWARKFFDGFRRNLTIGTRCVLFTDRRRDLPGYIKQVVDTATGSNGYGDAFYRSSLTNL
jgi:hypothetical protein